MNFNIKIDRSPACCPTWMEDDLQKIIDAWVVQDLKNRKWSKGNPHKPSREAVRRNVFKDLYDTDGFGDIGTHRVNEISLDVLSSPSLMSMKYHWCDVDCEIYITVKDEEIIIKYVDERDVETPDVDDAMVDRCPLVVALIEFITRVVWYDSEQIRKDKPCCHSAIPEPTEE